jgi:hypothetical protein
MQLIKTQDELLGHALRPDLPAEERSRLEAMLRRLDHLLRISRDSPSAANGDVDKNMLDAARRQLRERRERDRLFGSDIVAEPAWNILLELFVAGEEGREVSALAACAELPAPEPAVLRCVAHLVSAKLVVRQADAGSGSMSLTLSHAAKARMCDYLTRSAAA